MLDATKPDTTAIPTAIAPPVDSLSPFFVARIWQIVDIRRKTTAELADETGIPLDDLFAVYAGTKELTAHQLARLCQALDVHPLAIFDGIISSPKIIPEELLDTEVARIAARLQRLPLHARARIEAQIMRDTPHG